MTDNEIKEDCLKEAGIDLGRYSHTEMTEIKDALRRYLQAKLKLLGIADVSQQRELLKGFMKHIEKDGAISFRNYDWTIQLFEEDNKTLL